MPDDEIAPIGKMMAGTVDDARDPALPIYIPQDLLDRYDAHREKWSRWWDRRREITRPFTERAAAIERDRDELYNQREAVRDAVLAIPTTSPRGLLIKLAIAVEAQTLDDIEAALGECDYRAHDLLPEIVITVRAMAGTA